MSKPRQMRTIYALVVDDSISYFNTMDEVEGYMEREAIEQGVILEVVRVVHAEIPPEPEMEFVEVALDSLVEETPTKRKKR